MKKDIERIEVKVQVNQNIHLHLGRDVREYHIKKKLCSDIAEYLFENLTVLPIDYKKETISEDSYNQFVEEYSISMTLISNEGLENYKRYQEYNKGLKKLGFGIWNFDEDE